MHEHSLVRSLLGQVDALARREAGRVRSILVCVGEFAGVEKELLYSAFELQVTETAFPDAELLLESAPLQAVCDDCRRRFAVQRFRFVCPTCGSRKVTVVEGEQLVLKSITLERCDDE